MPESLAKVYIHVVFSTKDRRPAIGDEWRDALFGVLGAATKNIGCQSLLTAGVADHVHMLFQLSRTLSLSDAVGRIKSHSSWWVNQTTHRQRCFTGKRLCGVFREPVECRSRPGVHSTSTATPRDTDISDELRECGNGFGVMKSNGTIFVGLRHSFEA